MTVMPFATGYATLCTGIAPRASKSSIVRCPTASAAYGIPLWMCPWMTRSGRRRRTTASSFKDPSSGRHSSFSPPIVAYVGG